MKQYCNTFALLTLIFGLFFTLNATAQEVDKKGDIRELTIHADGNKLAFVETAFQVKKGEKIRLIFVNQATVQGMSHNVVIMAQKADINKVGLAAMAAADKDYIPEDVAILFHTPLAKPGESVEVTFNAPDQPGAYPFACTFPGHYVVMRGVMTVK